MAIRYTKKDEINLKKLVRNYNNKINRLNKKGFDTNFIPQKLKLKDERKLIKSGERIDFKDRIKYYESFLKRGSENLVKSNRGLVLPKYEIDQVNIMLKKINRIRRKTKKLYKEEPLTDRNKNINQANKSLLKNLSINELKDKKFSFKNKSKKDYEKFKKSLAEYYETQEERNKKYRDNYYKALENVFSEDQSNKIKNVLDKLETDVIINKYYTDINMDIDFVYEPSEQNLLFKETLNAWKKELKKHKSK